MMAATLRDRGHEDALSHYAVEAIRLTVIEVAERRTEFTSDDVRAALPAGTAESLSAWPNALGAVFRSMAQSGAIMDTGRMVRSTHEAARKRKVAVWTRGLFVL